MGSYADCTSMKKLTYEFVKNYFEKQGCKLVSNTYENSNTPLIYICNCGKQKSIRFDKFKQGRRCKECGYRRLSEIHRTPFEEVQRVFKEQRYELLSSTEEYINKSSTLRYICICGKEKTGTYDAVRQGHGNCRECAFKSQKETNLVKYGVESVLSLPQIREWQNTCIVLRNGSTCDRPALYKHENHKQRYCYECRPDESYVTTVLTFGIRYPELIPYWHHKNDLSPYDVSFCSTVVVKWKCGQNHEWEIKVNNQAERLHFCQFCANKAPSEGYNLKDCFPLIADEYVIRDGKPEPGAFLPFSDEIVSWKCPNDHMWTCQISQRTKGNRSCPYCKSLQFQFPEIASEWDFERNGELTLNITPGSQIKAWWKCSKGHSWQSVVNDRTRRGGCCCKICPKLRRGALSLEESGFPFVHQWHPFLNESFTLSTISSRSNIKVWWLCRQNHSYLASPGNRSNGDNCPYCSHKKASPEYNITITDPRVLAEWDYEKNEFQPSEYTRGSEKKVWWKCTEKRHPSYQLSLYRKCCLSALCPLCIETKGEKAVRLYLEKNGISFDPQWRDHDCRDKRPLPFDFHFVMEGRHICIEFQGRQHFEIVEFFGGSRGFEDRQKKDKIKREYCQANGIYLCEILYTEINRVEDIMNQFIISID